MQTNKPEPSSPKPSLLWRALRHEPLTPNERLVYTWLKTILFFLVAYVLSYLVDAVVNNRDLGSWNVYQGLLIGLGYLILASIYKYFMATSQEQAGIIIGKAVEDLHPLAEQRGRVVPLDVPDLPLPRGDLPC